MTSYVLITGGVGFIGSHTVSVLLEYGYNIVVLDNFSNTSEFNLKGLHTLHSQLNNETKLIIENIDLRDQVLLEKVFQTYKFQAVIHFAALKAVGESIQKPLLYYDNNIVGVLNLLQMVASHGITKFIFSSSATVYGSEHPPYDEEFSKVGLGLTNPYARTKMITEEILLDLHKASGLNVILLRYFNPIGSHPSGLLGEVPFGVPNNLFPYILDVAEGKRKHLQIFGKDYDTKDGTCIRDFIHVMDLADGHCEALHFLESLPDKKTFEVFNLGTGKGTSVLELLHTFEMVNNIKIDYVITERRNGDVEKSYAKVNKAERILGWTAKRSLEEMCIDGWNFRKMLATKK